MPRPAGVEAMPDCAMAEAAPRDPEAGRRERRARLRRRCERRAGPRTSRWRSQFICVAMRASQSRHSSRAPGCRRCESGGVWCARGS